MPDVILVF